MRRLCLVLNSGIFTLLMRACAVFVFAVICPAESWAQWAQLQELTASDAVAGTDVFGTTIAVNGNTAVVGDFGHTVGSNVNQGSAYVFVQSGGTWSQQAELTALDGAANDHFGFSVAVSGGTIVVGAPWHVVGSNQEQGSAYVFVQSGGTWSLQAELTASDGKAGDQFGDSVAVSGSTAVVGAPFGGGALGVAYVFAPSGGTWTLQAELSAPIGGEDFFGSSVAVDGSTVVVGAPCSQAVFNAAAGGWICGNGGAYVFVQSGGTWSQQAELTAPDGAYNDRFGTSVAISGSTVVVTAPDRTIFTSQGAAYVFAPSAGTWTQQAELTATDAAAGDTFGFSVAVDGGTIVVGAPIHTVGPYQLHQGAAYVFAPSGGTWSQQAELTASDGAPGYEFGESVAVSANTVLVVALAAQRHGEMYVFASTGQPALPTATSLTSNPNPSGTGQSVTFTATVTGQNGTPTGTVAFNNGGTTVATAPLVNGQATYAAVFSTVGMQSFTALYSGNGSYFSSTSPVLNQNVSTGPTTTMVSSSLNPSGVGQSVILTAVVIGQSPTGTVTFADNGSNLATVPLTGGVAYYTTNFSSTGSHSITGAYLGDSNNQPSASAALNQNVLQPAVPTFPANLGPVQNYNPGGTTSAPVIADLNHDGKPDLIVGSAGVDVFLGNGDGSFQPAANYSTGTGNVLSTTVADLNGDGNPDIVAANKVHSCDPNNPINCGDFYSIGVLLGNGDGTFRPVNIVSNGLQTSSIAVGDVNGDGRPDLIVAAGQCCGGIQIFLGNGDGTFQSPVGYTAATFANYVAVADVNGDGKLDLVVLDETCPFGCFAQFAVLLGNGDGTFQPAVNYTAENGPETLAVADVNGDGKPDVIFGDPDVLGRQAVEVRLGNGDGTFQAPVIYGSGGSAIPCCIASPPPSNPSIQSLAVADINGDGRPDLVVPNVRDMQYQNQCTPSPANPCTASSIGVLLGNGDGTFQPAVTFANPNTPNSSQIYESVGVADLNGDGKPDLIVGGNCPLGNCLWVLINSPSVVIAPSPQQPLTTDGSGNFVAQVTITNSGNVTVSTLQVNSATLASGSLLSPPAAIANLAPGQSAVVTLTFPPNSVLPGATTAPLKISGTYSVTSPALSGNWALTFRSVTL